MNRVIFDKVKVGNEQRIDYLDNELDNAPIVPIPVEYSDIDTEFYNFFNDSVSLVDDDGKNIPTFTLFSNQRFSEYSQTWQHTDQDGNLLMNFKTVNRENNPQFGTIHGGRYNIPRDNRFTVSMREVLEDNGSECYEIISMSQPMAIDLMYRISFVTSKYERLNDFNLKMNKLFMSKQCYIRPNGHYMPMVLDNISDETNYSIDDRKFFIQTYGIKVLAYIIPKDDIKVNRVPKRTKITNEFDRKHKTFVSMEYIDDENVEIIIEFKQGTTKVKFISEYDTECMIKDMINIGSIKLSINDDEYSCNKKFFIKKDDEVKFIIKQPRLKQPSKIVLSGKIIPM